VRAAPRLVAYSAELLPELRVLKTFLREKLYHHYQVLRMTDKARRIIQDLFGAFMNDPRLLPPQYQTMARSDKAARHRRLHRRDDRRYAMREHRRLFAVGEIYSASPRRASPVAALQKILKNLRLRRYIRPSPNVFERSPRRDRT
jgi:dGTPase